MRSGATRDWWVRKWIEEIPLRAQRFTFPYMTRKLKDDDLVFINYGYEEDPPLNLPLSADDEANRYFINLYHVTAGQTDIRGKRVLEVGCGHGGGASYLMRTFGPASYTGLDLNAAGIDYCQKKHDVPGLDFTAGDAEDLPFADHSFDVLINVESGCLYPRFSRFLSEVQRVLRPGGDFLYADHRASYKIPTWETELAETPMRMVSERVINAEVARGIEKNMDWARYAAERTAPPLLRQLALRGHKEVQARLERGSVEPDSVGSADPRNGSWDHFRMYHFTTAD
ncbi:class I SAM-dependent methyltransferase [Mycolicibacterium sp. 050232]|uniref:phthiotriol/phenolphthiotriol dimycocerosates methyltransferase n=1 Tax=Mycolicibacterium sp. 050232 TaxID=3113982 RepID=UPI002E285B63|nr:class I SAM-dependent methyltransferase [Mycolicibacterium sp. 050232]MED5814675.1 class I SAM-dependent methyltransferase [Mycolicibacterium sp. 050232]